MKGSEGIYPGIWFIAHLKGGAHISGLIKKGLFAGEKRMR